MVWLLNLDLSALAATINSRYQSNIANRNMLFMLFAYSHITNEIYKIENL